MISGLTASIIFGVFTVIVCVFLWRQYMNMNSIIAKAALSGDRDEKASSTSDNELDKLIKKRLSSMRKTFMQASILFIKAEMRYLIPYIVCYSLVILMLTGARGRKSIYEGPSTTVDGVEIPGVPIVTFEQDWIFGLFSFVAFICGAVTSAVSGLIGILVATSMNAAVAHKLFEFDDPNDDRPGAQKGFETCLRGGGVTAFGMFSVAIVNVFVLSCLFLIHYNVCSNPLDCNQKAVVYTMLSYAIGASSISILRRVGGSIYMKSIDLCREMLKAPDNLDKLKLAKPDESGIVHVEHVDLPEFDSRNPFIVADNVGDIIGDVAGAGSDFFGSFTLAICALNGILGSAINTLDTDGNTPLISHWSLICLPLLVLGCGIVVSMIVYLLRVTKGSKLNFPIDGVPRDEVTEVKRLEVVRINVENALWYQCVIAALIHAPLMFMIIVMMLPDEFYVDYWEHVGTHNLSSLIIKDWHMGLCAVIGSVVGLIGGYIGKIYTTEGSSLHTSSGKPGWVFEAGTPVKSVFSAATRSHNAGFVTNLGLSYGHQSVLATCLNLAFGIYLTHSLGRGFGVAFCALGCMGTISTTLISTAFGPIAKNARAMAEMSGMPREPCLLTAQRLSQAGSNVLAMSKGFSITAAALCAFAMISCYVLRTDLQRKHVTVFEPLCMGGLLIGAMLPYRMSSMMISAIKKTALKVRCSIIEQFTNEGSDLMKSETRPEYIPNVEEATNAALRHLAPIALLMVVTPLVVGLLFGRAAVVGVALGTILVGVPLSVSSANAGGIWSMTLQKLSTNYHGPTSGYAMWKARLLTHMVDMNDWERDSKDDDYDEYEDFPNFSKCRDEVKKNAPDPEYFAVEVANGLADPLKDAIAPAISILVKEMAITSAVLGPYFASCRGGYGTIGCELSRNCDTERYPMEGFDYVILAVLVIMAVVFLVVQSCQLIQARKERISAKNRAEEKQHLLNGIPTESYNTEPPRQHVDIIHQVDVFDRNNRVEIIDR